MKRSVLGTMLVLMIFTHFSVGATLDLSFTGASGNINGAIFTQITPKTAAGTGVFESFLRIQAKGSERGYNTDALPQYDELKGSWTHSLQLSAVPVITLDGVQYREFCLDINETNNAPGLSLDQLKIFVETSGNLTGYPASFSAPVYDLGNNWVKMNYDLNAGSGKGDMILYVPSSLFGTNNSNYVYLYSALGANLASDDGFEEWGVGNLNGNATPITPDPVPEPVTILLLSVGALTLLRRR